ncbi:hypothetical protein [Sulfoacidibacillus ferrooxidans]|uniref:Uncharacterized protein n=1 Tax=Sulfoacidibacillus ferrooxidans TaxID=2005001 RepID=A0A9X1V912_9BACL|nr:hypothetical protein [Sulfoacidibacillus ferrooxidans]MCI0183392.1 hypothetical protein [Sulfoacidibacillus ferrooxidans]
MAWYSKMITGYWEAVKRGVMMSEHPEYYDLVYPSEDQAQSTLSDVSEGEGMQMSPTQTIQ